MIHVCFCFRDKTGRYSKFAGTSMLSVFENTDSKVTVHILHDKTLTDENRDKFSQLAGHYEQAVKFYNLDELCENKLAKIKRLVPTVEKTVATIGAFYKMLIPQVLSKKIKKAIFLDPDTIVNLDISELWEIELENECLGVVTEKENGVNVNKAFPMCSEGLIKETDYFNCGVLLMNLTALRRKEKTIVKGVRFRGENPKHKYLEQTVLNYCFSENTLKLPLKFNRFVRQERSSDNPILADKIYHYSGGTSRPRLDMNEPFNRLWMSYFIKSPWFDVDAVGKLCEGFKKSSGVQQTPPLAFIKVMPGKMRAFFVEPAKLNSVKSLFDIKDFEQVILAENEASIEKLIDTMKTYAGACVFFIMTEKFLDKNFPFERLIKEGFVEDKDFFKGWTFTTDTRVKATDDYSLISAM